MSAPDNHRALLLRVARQAMLERGLEPDFAPAALAEAERLPDAPPPAGADVRDLRDLVWCSIDNDDSRDLDQLTVAKALPPDAAQVLIAVADVSAAVSPAMAIEAHAVTNTTSVYTPPRNFPMLPERLSTDLTSLGQGRRGLGRRLGRLPRPGAQRGQARLLERRRLARGPRAHAGGDRRRARPGRQPATSRSRGPAPARQPPRAWRPRPRDPRGPRQAGGRPGRRSGARRAQPRQADHRGLHDRGQRRHRPVPGRAPVPDHAPGRALARALAAHRRAGPGAGRA
ncbi:MAG: RNB domain-containing ribonuclease, partial [Candidatus Eisenbacteria bacterium]